MNKCGHSLGFQIRSLVFGLLIVVAILQSLYIFSPNSTVKFYFRTNISLLLVQLGCRLLYILKRLLPISVYLLQVRVLFVGFHLLYLWNLNCFVIGSSISYLNWLVTERRWVSKWSWCIPQACCFCLQQLCRIYWKSMPWKVNCLPLLEYIFIYIFYYKPIFF